MSSQYFPKISIVTPSFNQGQFLEQTILSILNQNYPNLEYIVIDGGSTDGSTNIIKKYEQNLNYWCSEPDKGQYDAINKGFARATGDVFAWLNSDDMYCPWALKTVGSIFSQHEELRWLTTLNQLIWDEHGHCISLKTMPGYSKEAFLDGCYLQKSEPKCLGYIQQESTFWRKSLWNDVSGLSLKYPLAGDFDLWSRFYQHADLYGTYSPLGGFRVHEQNRSTNFEGYALEAENALRAMRENTRWAAPLSEKVATFLANRNQSNPLFRYFLGISSNQYDASNVLRDLSDENGDWKIVNAKFTAL